MSSSGQPVPSALAVRGVGKTFRLPEQQVHTLKERALHPMRRIGHTSYRALEDISFDVRRGEFFGIVGRNGCGKSTLLKCIAGIYACDGEIYRQGRLATFIELGVGFNPDLAARDNVITNALMMGLTPREAKRRYDEVIDFAELREFEDLKLKNYSSGMHVRLAFSVAIQVDADMLLVDEILAVGDANFQQKCFDVFTRMHNQGKTIILVTHSMTELNRFCDRALLLERGREVMIGDPREVGDRYLELNFAREPEPEEAAAAPDAAEEDAGEARVEAVWVENEKAERQTAVAQGHKATIRGRVKFLVDVEDPQVNLTVLNDAHETILVASTSIDQERSGKFSAGEEALVSFTFDNVLRPGRYSPVLYIFHRGAGLEVIDRFDGASSFVVTGAMALGGVVDIPFDVTIQHHAEQGGGVTGQVTA